MKLYNKIALGAALSFAALATGGCRENPIGVVDLTPNTSTEDVYEPVYYSYNITSENMGVYNKSDFQTVKAMLDNGTAPAEVVAEFEALKASPYATKNYSPSPLTYIVRGDGAEWTDNGSKEQYIEACRDASAAYQLGMLWQLTGDEDYAKAGVNVLEQWAAKCKGLISKDMNIMLAAGAQGYTFACGALMLRDYSGWDKYSQATVTEWLLDKFATLNSDYMLYHGGTCEDHYWSNWDLVNMCAYMSIGILAQRDDMINLVVNYFYDGTHNTANDGVIGNGCIKKLVQAYFDDPLNTGETIGQNQESGRDQGHAMMSTAVAAQLAQLAWSLYQTNTDKPELDFFAANNNALMNMGEYVALCNLRSGTDADNASGSWLIETMYIPFQTYYYCGGENQEGPVCSCTSKTHGATHTAVANDDGRGNLRPNWEIYYNHYKRVKGLSSGYMYAKKAADKMRPECGSGDSRYGYNSGAYDQVGWNTLMLYRGE